MPPALLLSTINVAMDFVNILMPQLREMIARGQITPAQQAEVFAKYKSLKLQAESPFSGPEWKVE